MTNSWVILAGAFILAAILILSQQHTAAGGMHWV
jgi:hypothetical protein